MRRLRAAAAAYSRHACGELAAAIAYRVLFAVVPSIALLAAVLDAVLPRTARVAFVEWLLGAFPGTTVESSVEQELANAGALTSLTGLVAFVTLLWTASGMTRSLRVALGRRVGHRPASGVRAREAARCRGARRPRRARPGGLPALAGGPDRRPGRGRSQRRAGARRRGRCDRPCGGPDRHRRRHVRRAGARLPAGRPRGARVHGRLARGAGRRRRDRRRAGRLRVLPRQRRRPGHHLRAAGCAARAVGPAVHGGGDRALRRRAAGLTRSG